MATAQNFVKHLGESLYNAVLSVPVHVKISGIILLPVLILGLSLNYWVTTGLSDWLSYLLTDVRVEAAMRAGSRSVILVTVLAAVGSILMGAFLTFILTRPLLALREMAQKVANGDLNARAPVWSNDEIGEVAMAVNTMTDHLVSTQDELARTNRRLTAINRIILAADREVDIHDILYAVLENVLDVMGLQMGWVFLRDPERDQFHLASWYNVPAELEDFLLQNPGDALCECQQNYMAGNLTPGVNVCACKRLKRCACIGVNNRHITISIEAQNQKFGVMNLLCRENHLLSEEDMDLLSAIGVQISEIVANAWLRLKLAEKEKARQLLLESLVEAQEEERSRLARELHDGAGQMLASLLARIKTLEKKSASKDVRNGLSETLDVVSETIEQVRELSYGLRPVALEEFGLPVALETLVKDMGLAERCHIDAQDIQLPPGVEVTLYRIAQEALTNVLRHAQAGQVNVLLTQNAGQVCLQIKDNGRGFTPQRLSAKSGKHHLGLLSMHERAEIAGGALNIYSAPGQGTTIQVHIPILESVN